MPARRTQQEPCGERRDSSLRCHVIRPGGRKEDVTQVCRAWIATAGTDNPQLGGRHVLIFWTRLAATSPGPHAQKHDREMDQQQNALVTR